MEQPIITINHLTKTFKLSKKQQKINGDGKSEKTAVDDITFDVKKGEIFGLLGPNGAGKTTTLRMLSALVKPTSGNIIMDDIDAKKNPNAIRENITFLTNELKLDTHFTPSYTIKYFGRLRNMSDDLIDKRTKELFETFGITEFSETKIGDLSTGMKQKTSIAVSLIHDPPLIIFDEPTSGLDVITAKNVTDYLLEQKKIGKTIIISTHYMHVAEKLSDRLAIIMNGKITAYGTLNEVLETTKKHSLEDAFFNLYEESNHA